MAKLLRFENLTKRFGTLVANDQLNLSFQKGEIHALIGENGAGKSTLMKMLFGMLTPDEGKIYWQDQEIQFRSPHEAVRHGIGMVQQNLSLAEQLTVYENVIAGAEPHRWGWMQPDVAAPLESLLQALDCDLPLFKRVETLSIAQKQLVEIVRLLWRKVQLIILDEPTSLLGPVEIQALFRMLKNLKKQGVTIIFITHRLKEVLDIADRTSVLRKGKLVTTVDQQMDEVGLARLMFVDREQQKRDLFSGRSLDPEQTVLHVEQLENAQLSVSFQVQRGEVLGVVALPGNGGEALAAMLGGTLPWNGGRLTLVGQTLKHYSPSTARSVGLGYLPEDRMGEAVVPGFSVAENVGLGRIHTFCRNFAGLPMIHWKGLIQRALDLKEQFSIKIERPQQLVSTLSGGNVQRLILAREFDAAPRVMVMVHPTQGIDLAGARQIKAWLMEKLFEDDGLEAAIIITSDLEEILDVAHRILVLYRGKVCGEFDGTTLDKSGLDEIGLLLTGQITKASGGL